MKLNGKCGKILENKTLLLSILLIALCIIPIFVKNIFYVNLLVLVGIYVILTLGLSIIVGNVGLLSMGYAAYYAIGAYTTAILTVKFNFSFWLTIPIALLTTGIAGILVGWPTLRLRGDYLAMVTIGFGEIVRITFTNLKITGSADGIYGIPSPKIGSYIIGQPWQMYYLCLIFAVATYVAISRLDRSRIGRAWASTRNDENAAQAMGINTVWVKILAFILSSMFAGLAGTLYAVQMTAVAPETFNFTLSCMLLLGVVIGGMSNTKGLVGGAAVVVVLPELLRNFAGARMLIFGIALVLLMLFRPQGLFPAKKHKIEGV